jgi:hypothetical protein
VRAGAAQLLAEAVATFGLDASLPSEKLSRPKVEKLTRDIGEDRAAQLEKVAGD